MSDKMEQIYLDYAKSNLQKYLKVGNTPVNVTDILKVDNTFGFAVKIENSDAYTHISYDQAMKPTHELCVNLVNKEYGSKKIISAFKFTNIDQIGIKLEGIEEVKLIPVEHALMVVNGEKVG